MPAGDLKARLAMSLKNRFMIFLLRRKKFTVIMINLRNAASVNCGDFAGVVLPLPMEQQEAFMAQIRSAGKHEENF